MSGVEKVQATTITIKKGQGLTQALRDLVKKQNMVMSDGSISAAEWNKTIDKLTEIQEKRKADGKESIFSGGTDRTDFRGSYVVHPEQQINFTEDEMKELYDAMGVSFANAEETENAETVEGAENEAAPAENGSDKTEVKVGNGNGITIIIDGDNNDVRVEVPGEKKAEEADEADAADKVDKADKSDEADKAKEVEHTDKTKKTDEDKKADETDKAKDKTVVEDKNKTTIDTLKDVIGKLLDLIKAENPVKADKPETPTKIKEEKPDDKKLDKPKDKLTDETQVTEKTIIEKLIVIIKLLLGIIPSEHSDLKINIPKDNRDIGIPSNPEKGKKLRIDVPIDNNDRGIPSKPKEKTVYVNLQPGQCIGKDFKPIKFNSREEELLWRYQNISGLTPDQSMMIKRMKSVEEIKAFLKSQGITIKVAV